MRCFIHCHCCRLLSIQGPQELVTPLVGIYLNNVETGRTYTKEQNHALSHASIPLRVVGCHVVSGLKFGRWSLSLVY